jgi:hypothetical protein
MTVEEFTVQIEALVIKAQAGGVSIEDEIAVLQGILDALKEPAHDQQGVGTSSIAQSANGQ